MKTELNGVPETLLITVKARAEETVRADSLLQDTFAVDILKKLHFEKSSKDKVAPSSQIGVVVRTQLFDRIVDDFSKRNPDGIIIALGCGLDARYERLRPACSMWYDLDLPESIHVRKSFFEEKDNYKMIAQSMFDYSWMDLIDNSKPLLIISEGVFMYFSEEDIRPLVLTIFKKLPHAELAFDTIPPFLAKRSNLHTEIRKYNAPFKWGLDKAEDLRKWDNSIIIISQQYTMNYHLRRWPLSMRLLRLIPKINRGTKVVHIKYSSK